jgi:uncharacterized BrkB/YihY/UPF0761 family membrane protein
MSFNIVESFNNIVNSKNVSRVLSSPILSSIILVLLILITVYFVLPKKAAKKMSVSSYLIKLGIYIFIITTSMLFLHFNNIKMQTHGIIAGNEINRVLSTKNYDDSRDKENRDVPIYPKINNQTDDDNQKHKNIFEEENIKELMY